MCFKGVRKAFLLILAHSLVVHVSGQNSKQSVKAQTNPTIINYGDGDVTVTTSADTSSKSEGGSGGSHPGGSFPTANVGDQFSPQFMDTLLSAMAKNGGGEIELGGNVVNQKSEASTYAIGRSPNGEETTSQKLPLESQSKGSDDDERVYEDENADELIFDD